MKKEEILSVYETTSLSARLRLAAGHDNAGDHVLVVGYDADSQHLIGRYLNGLHADGAFYAFDADHLEDVPTQLTADGLAAVFGGRGHPEFSRQEWRYAVRDCATQLGYWDWVAECVNGRTTPPVCVWQISPPPAGKAQGECRLEWVVASTAEEVADALAGTGWFVMGKIHEPDPDVVEREAFELRHDRAELLKRIKGLDKPDLGAEVPTWQVHLPKFTNLAQTQDKIIIIRAHRGADVVDAVNGRADCAGRWYTPVENCQPAVRHYFELPRDQAELDKLLDAEGYQLTPDGRLKV